MIFFAKFEKFLLHNIVMPSFMTVRGQMPELDWGLFASLPSPPLNVRKSQCPIHIRVKEI